MTSAAENEAWLRQLVGVPLDGAEAQLDGSFAAAPEAMPATGTSESDSIARLRGIFSSLDEDIITAVVTSNGGALVPSILQLIELADENDTAGCIEELEAALHDAAIRDEAPRQAEARPDLPRSASLDEQVALAAQSDMDEQLALALQQKLDADEAAAAATAAAAASNSRAASPPALSSWRRNVAKLAAKLSPSEVRQVLERLRKTGLYRGRAGTARLIDPNEADVTADNNESSDNNEADEREYEPPVPLAPPAPKPSAEALYESRIARARSARAASLRSGTRPNQAFVDLTLVPEAA